MRNIILVLLSLLFSYGCQMTQSTDCIQITKEMEDLPAAKASELIDSLSYIQLETSEECMMGYASRYSIKPIPLGFVVYAWSQNSEPMVFSPEGKFIGRIGRIGRGPGEFLSPYRLSYSEDDQMFIIVQHRSILFFDLDLDHVKTIKLDTDTRYLSKIVPMTNGQMAAAFWEPTESELIRVGVLILDNEGKITMEYDLTDPDTEGSYSGHWTMNSLYLNDGKLTYSNGGDRKILSLNKRGGWELEACVDFYFPPVPRSILEMGRDSHNARDEYMRNNPRISYVSLSGDFIRTMYSTPKGYVMYFDRTKGQVYNCAYSKTFNTWGLENDLDGGRPIELRTFSGEKSYELIDMQNIFRDIENLANQSKGVNQEMYNAFQDLLKKLKISDNPIIRVSHLKK